MKNFQYILAVVLSLMLTLSSCKNYLDVNPKSSVAEDQLFNSEVGFQQALDGVYSIFASPSLFGDHLSMGFTSALAQNYAIISTMPLYESYRLNYSSAEVVGIGNQIWSTGYNAIAGANKVIQNTEQKRNILSDNGYRRIRGEALALRAYMHFELLRLFGPEYNSGLNKKAIPYKTSVDQFTVLPSTTQDVVIKVLADLTEAEQLLMNIDPILTGQTNRNNKLNYYAIKALQARVNLYAGDKAKASAAAKTVVDSGKFPFVTNAAATNSDPRVKDRIYVTEQIFGLRVTNLKNWADPGYFRGASTMRRTTSDYQVIYESTASIDIRYSARIEADASNGNVSGIVFPSKFWQTYPGTALTDARLDQWVPMLRLSEMYYILAECAATPAEGLAYLNMVRTNRNLPLLPTTYNQTQLNTEITKEYQKEFYAEGQLFFYYKRKNTLRMQFMTANLSLSQYVLPIPDSELEFNPNYN